MTELLCKGKRYSWSSDCQSTFDELKKKLTTAPILTPPDESQPFQVFCDASLQGLGGVLMQGKNIVEYTSRQLKTSERNYLTHDLELRLFLFQMWRSVSRDAEKMISPDTLISQFLIP